jgi:hypothetical protein
MHAFYTIQYYTHFYIIHLLSLTMHGLGTGNTLLTAVAASRSKALIWSDSATSRAVLPSYWHQIRTRYYIWGAKTITNLAYPKNTTPIITNQCYHEIIFTITKILYYYIKQESLSFSIHINISAKKLNPPWYHHKTQPRLTTLMSTATQKQSHQNDRIDAIQLLGQ